MYYHTNVLFLYINHKNIRFNASSDVPKHDIVFYRSSSALYRNRDFVRIERSMDQALG